MKSYFTRLAARATSSKIAILPPANIASANDSFAQSVLSENSSAPSIARVSRAKSTPNDLPSTEQSRLEKTAQVRLPSNRAEPDIGRLPSPSPAIATQIPTVIADEPSALTRRKNRSAPASKTPGPTEVKPAKIITRSNSAKTSDESGFLPPVQSANKSGENGAHPRRAEAERIPDREVDTQTEETRLLTKADVFMAKLFDRQSGSVNPQHVDTADEPEKITRPLTEPASLPSGHPIKSIERSPKPEPDPPSVVIGRLTVEVVPPATPLAARQVTGVTRITRRGPNTVPSSRRFGFSQF